ncbi:MAG: hypothetical protein JO189_33810 [Deltaproteobacteria bacterium]|nr:hypothetical protein [Deltaproteobacteria bacterium]
MRQLFIQMLSFRIGRQNWDVSVIAADLRVHRKLGISGISRLTFGAHRAIAYPASFEMFAHGGGNMMRPKLPIGTQALIQPNWAARLQEAASEITNGIEAADMIVPAAGSQLSGFERMVWDYEIHPSLPGALRRGP